MAIRNPENVKIEFEAHILRPDLKNAVDTTLSGNPFLNVRLNCLSNVKKDVVFNLASTLFDNSLFSKSDVELNQIIGAIIRAQVDATRDAA